MLGAFLKPRRRAFFQNPSLTRCPCSCDKFSGIHSSSHSQENGGGQDRNLDGMKSKSKLGGGWRPHPLVSKHRKLTWMWIQILANNGTLLENKMLLGQMLQTLEEPQNTIQLYLDEFHMFLHEVLACLPSTSSTTTTHPRNQASPTPPQGPQVPP